jgi:uncharacterized membrane protein
MSDASGEDLPTPEPEPTRVADDPRGEHRWPAAVAIVVSLLLPMMLVSSLKGAPRFWLTVVGLVLLVATIITDPGRIDRRTRLTRFLSIALLLVLGARATVGTVRLVAELLEGAPALDNPRTLLFAGAVIWLENGLVFSLFFWELDAGGPAERLQKVRPHPDFAFPQQMNPELAAPTWRPRYHDYLYLSLTNALAFSPTDAMPLTAPAKLSMAFQSLLSVAILSLVIANAVNILGSAT